MSAEKLSPRPFSSLWLWNYYKSRRRRSRELNLLKFEVNAANSFSLDKSGETSSSSSEDEQMDWLDESLAQLGDSRSESDSRSRSSTTGREDRSEQDGIDIGDSDSEVDSDVSNSSDVEIVESNNHTIDDEADEESSTADESTIKVCDMKNGECIVFLNSKLNSEKVPLCLSFGNVVITCLTGSVTLNGFELKETNSVNVFAGLGRLRCNSVILKNCRPANLTEKLLKEKLKAININRDILNEIMSSIEEDNVSHLAVLHMKKYESYPFMVLESLSDDVSLWENKWFQFDCLRKRVPMSTASFESDLRNSILSRITSESIVIACGPKNTGKSSVLRWLINSVLSGGHKEVYFVDCDPGQSEFTTPGLLSFTFVDQPILAPPFVSVQTFKSRIFYSTSVGDISVADNPECYLMNFKQLWEQTVNFLDFAGRKPILINTMGWMKDIGLQLLVEIIKTVRPTDLIELTDIKSDAKKTYQELTAANVREMTCWSTGSPSLGEDEIDVNYNYVKLQLTKGREVKSTREAANNRNNAQLSYFSLCEEAAFKPFKDIKTFKYKLSDVFLHVVFECPIDKYLIVDILINSWVHLCRVCEPIPEEEEDIHVLQELNENMCLGCGIVREINLDDGYISILSPEGKDRLNLVNCIIKPMEVNVPDQIKLT